MKRFAKILCVMLTMATILTSLSAMNVEAAASTKKIKKSGKVSGVEYKANCNVSTLSYTGYISDKGKIAQKGILVSVRNTDNQYPVKVVGTISLYTKSGKKIPTKYIDESCTFTLYLMPNERDVYALTDGGSNDTKPRKLGYTTKYGKLLYTNYKVSLKVTKVSTTTYNKYVRKYSTGTARTVNGLYRINDCSLADAKQAAENYTTFATTDTSSYTQEEKEVFRDWVRSSNLYYYNYSTSFNTMSSASAIKDKLSNSDVLVTDINYIDEFAWGTWRGTDYIPCINVIWKTTKAAKKSYNLSTIVYYDKNGYPLGQTQSAGKAHDLIFSMDLWKGYQSNNLFPLPMTSSGKFLTPVTFDIKLAY